MAESSPIITLLTDFGEADAFVGTMKGVMLGISPNARLVDLSHQIPPQDVKQAAYVLMTAVPYFPKGTVHMVVVDPGVGSSRRPVAVETPNYRFVAPDNGVLSYVLAQVVSFRAVEIANPKYRLANVSSTFHGRDIFSPAAAHLAAEVKLNELGPGVDRLVMLDFPRLEVDGSKIEAEVLNVDHFGNLRTSINALIWEDANTLTLQPSFSSDQGGSARLRFSAADALVKFQSFTIRGISTTFSDVEVGQPVAYVGSEGGLEIAINQGSAARQFGAKVGDSLLLRVHLLG